MNTALNHKTLQSGAINVDLRSLARQRLARLRERMQKSAIDALLVSSPENVLYASGYESMPATINRRYGYCAIVTADELIMVAPTADCAAAEEAGFKADEFYPFGEFYFSGDRSGMHGRPWHNDFADALAAAMTRIKPKQISIEFDHLPASIAESLKNSDFDTTDATSFMLQTRAQKFGDEIALLRHAASITEQAIDAGIRAAEVGVSEKEIASIVAATMSMGGGFTRNVTVVGGPRSAYCDCFPANRALEPGDLLRFDVGCSYFGYKSDLARTAVVGEPTKFQASRYRALLKGLEAEIEAARAGTAASKVFEAGMRTVEREGFANFRRHHLGHSIGLAVYEAPVINAHSEARLQENATFCLETPYYEPGWGGMMCEDTGIVTSSGFELISSLDRSLRVIPC